MADYSCDWRFYTQDFYVPINNQLRQQRVSRLIYGLIDVISSDITLYGSPMKGKFYRGTHQFQEFKVGDTFTEYGFMSKTTDRSVADQFSAGLLFIIRYRKPVPHLALGSFMNWPFFRDFSWQSEFITYPGEQFIVTKIKDNVIYMDRIGNVLTSIESMIDESMDKKVFALANRLLNRPFDQISFTKGEQGVTMDRLRFFRTLLVIKALKEKLFFQVCSAEYRLWSGAIYEALLFSYRRKFEGDSTEDFGPDFIGVAALYVHELSEFLRARVIDEVIWPIVSKFIQYIRTKSQTETEWSLDYKAFKNVKEGETVYDLGFIPKRKGTGSVKIEYMGAPAALHGPDGLYLMPPGEMFYVLYKDSHRVHLIHTGDHHPHKPDRTAHERFMGFLEAGRGPMTKEAYILMTVFRSIGNYPEYFAIFSEPYVKALLLVYSAFLQGKDILDEQLAKLKEVGHEIEIG
jgi:hypothetical protein